MTPSRTLYLWVSILVVVSLADPGVLKRPSRPGQFGSEAQVRKYLAELQEYIRQNPPSRYGKRFAVAQSAAVFPQYHQKSNDPGRDLLDVYPIYDYSSP